MEEGIYQLGTIIGKHYQILGILGEGNTGITYLAQDLENDQEVAIKVLSLQRLTDWKMLDLFEREGKILAKLKNPRIPRYLDYFDVDTPEDRAFYLVQEKAEGESLATLVENGWRGTEKEIKNIAFQLLTILIYLHSIEPPVIHRDIKPHNIIRQENGEIFLVDFGAVQDTYHSTFRSGSTIVGTYGYMAPEQFRGQSIPQTDLYGVGATILFLLTHRSPSELPTDRLKINFRSHLQISESFADWLEKMLEPDLHDRFASAKEALAVLQGKKITKYQQNFSVKKVVILGAGILTVGLLSYFKYPILSYFGFTPRAMYEAIKNGNLEIVKHYIDQGINVNAKDFTNHTPLHWAVSNNKIDIAEFLIENGADIHEKYDSDKHTLLHLAVQHQSKDMAELLINKGANVNVKDSMFYTPLHTALLKKDVNQYFGMSHQAFKMKQSPEMIELLIKNGADVNAISINGRKPIHLVKDSEVEILLENAGANY